jgi:hypothetical protein
LANNETDTVRARCSNVMSSSSSEDSGADHFMERQLIRVDGLPDQAGIAAALRRAFAAGPPPECFEEDDPFAELLKRLH